MDIRERATCFQNAWMWSPRSATSSRLPTSSPRLTSRAVSASEVFPSRSSSVEHLRCTSLVADRTEDEPKNLNVHLQLRPPAIEGDDVVLFRSASMDQLRHTSSAHASKDAVRATSVPKQPKGTRVVTPRSPLTCARRRSRSTSVSRCLSGARHAVSFPETRDPETPEAQHVSFGLSSFCEHRGAPASATQLGRLERSKSECQESQRQVERPCRMRAEAYTTKDSESEGCESCSIFTCEKCTGSLLLGSKNSASTVAQADVSSTARISLSTT